MNQFTKAKLASARDEVRRLETQRAEERRAENRARMEREAKDQDEVRRKLEIDNGIDWIKTPKLANAIWDYAWEDGHSEGFNRVVMIYEELVERIVNPARRGE